MHRLFVAIRPPRPIRERLLAAMGGVPGARWQDDGQLHLTLRFIGEVDRHAGEDVVAALGTIHHPGFDLALHGFGTFERKGRVETLWAGVAPHAPLKGLHNKIDQALVRAGLAAEGRAYLPHITLARFGRCAGPPAGLPALAGGLSSPPFTVDAIWLFESSLGSEGATYSLVERFALERPGFTQPPYST